VVLALGGGLALRPGGLPDRPAPSHPGSY